MQFSLPIKYKRSEIEGAFDLPVNINLNGFPNKGNFNLFLDKKLSINTPINSLSLKFVKGGKVAANMVEMPLEATKNKNILIY